MSTSNKVFLAAIIVGIVATVYMPQLLMCSLGLILVGIKLRRQ